MFGRCPRARKDSYCIAVPRRPSRLKIDVYRPPVEVRRPAPSPCRPMVFVVSARGKARSVKSTARVRGLAVAQRGRKKSKREVGGTSGLPAASAQTMRRGWFRR